MQNLLLKARGLHTFENMLSAVPAGALTIADNAVIDRDEVLESRRGFPLYGNSMGAVSSTRAKQKFKYKDVVLRHFLDDLEFDNGSGAFSKFAGDYSEVDVGLRIKGIEANGNFYFTTSNGVKKISASSSAGLTTATGFITDAGGIKAIDIDGNVNYTNPGFFTEKSKVAYRVVWGIRDNNNNLVLGTPSARLVLTNPSTTLTATVDLQIAIPNGVTTNYFYQVYRSAVKEAGALDLDEIEPEDELYLVIEDFPSDADIIAGEVDVSDITPDTFREGGTLLYTNPVSGEGILQANEPPPLAKDLALFKGSTYYANTKTRHRQTISLLSVSGFTSGVSAFTISNGLITNTYTFRGQAESTQFTFDTKANTADGSYFIIYSSEDERKYVVWFDKTGTTLEPSGPDTLGALFISVNITGATTANDVANAVQTAMFANANGDFTYGGSISPLVITNSYNGNATNATTGAVAPGGVFAISVLVPGQGEDEASKYVLLSNNPSVAQAVEETAKSLVKIINAQASDAVYAYYLSGTQDVPGEILFENRNITAIPFYISVSDSTIAAKWTPTLPVYKTITNISATSPVVITSASHGFTTGNQVILGNTNSTPAVNGVYTITVLNSNTFSIPINLSAGVAGTSGLVFLTTAYSDNETSPNRLYYSKNDQPEAVPILNYLNIGPKDEPILRILALRDSLFVLKTDGIYRVTGEIGQTPTYTLFDSSTLIVAADTAAVLNNQIYMLSTQGVATISDTGVSIISRPIEDRLIKLASDAYTAFSTASWALGYESDRAYILATITNTTDTVATQIFRYNTFTTSWTRWTKTTTCGVVGEDDRLYFGAGDINYSERERKEFSRKDYADRQYDVALLSDSMFSNGMVFKPNITTNIAIGDVIAQTLYVTIAQFNRLLRKLDDDIYITDTNYYSTLGLESGDNLVTAMTGLVAKLNADDSSRFSKTFLAADVNTGTNVITINNHGYTNDEIVHFSSTGTLPGGLSAGTPYYLTNVTTNTFQVSLSSLGTAIDLTTTGSGTHTVTNNYYYSGDTDFSDIQDEYNIIIQQLNGSDGLFYSNFKQSLTTTEYEIIVTDINRITNRVTAEHQTAWLQGPLVVYKAIDCVVQWAPQSMQDVSILKQVREGTVIFENLGFYGASVSYRSDLSRVFETIPFYGRGVGAWGMQGWGEILWGGEGPTNPLRTLIPQQKQRCRYIDCKFRHIVAREKFALYGISLTYETNSSKAYR